MPWRHGVAGTLGDACRTLDLSAGACAAGALKLYRTPAVPRYLAFWDSETSRGGAATMSPLIACGLSRNLDFVGKFGIRPLLNQTPDTGTERWGGGRDGWPGWLANCGGGLGKHVCVQEGVR